MSSIVGDVLAKFRDSFDGLPQWAKVITGAAIVVPAAYYTLVSNRKRPSPYKTDFEKDVVYLYQFFRSPTIPSLSPYSLKLETWLRLYNVKYESVSVPFGVMSKEGTMPFIELNGVEHPDSGFCIRDLIYIKKVGEEKELSDEQRCTARAIETMVEESLVWSAGYLRYLEKQDELWDAALPASKKTFLMNTFLYIMKPFMRAKITKTLFMRGIGKHSRDEIVRKGLDDIRALSAFLGNKQFFFGDKPTRVDCAVFGVIAGLVYVPIDIPHQRCINNDCANLRAWCDRMKERIWPDWEQVCKDN